MQFVGTDLNTDIIPDFEAIKQGLKNTIDSENGLTQEDPRWNRKVRTLPGDFIVLERSCLEALAQKNVIVKYVDDWNRMKPGFDWCVEEALKDNNSRRLCFFNNEDYYNVFPCFGTFQFIITNRGDYDLYVYQRSSDLAKLQDDSIFFANVAKEFEDAVGIKVAKIVIIFGSVHYELRHES